MSGLRGASLALDEAQREGTPFDLVSLDYHMPSMDGLSLANAIRERKDGASLLLVMYASLAPSAGLRNRLVHEYEAIDDMVVIEACAGRRISIRNTSRPWSDISKAERHNHSGWSVRQFSFASVYS